MRACRAESRQRRCRSGCSASSFRRTADDRPASPDADHGVSSLVDSARGQHVCTVVPFTRTTRWPARIGCAHRAGTAARLSNGVRLRPRARGPAFHDRLREMKRDRLTQENLHKIWIILFTTGAHPDAGRLARAVCDDSCGAHSVRRCRLPLACGRSFAARAFPRPTGSGTRLLPGDAGRRVRPGRRRAQPRHACVVASWAARRSR